MGGGFLIDMLAVLKPVTYFTPMAVLEFCRGIECRGTERKEK